MVGWCSASVGLLAVWLGCFLVWVFARLISRLSDQSAGFRLVSGSWPFGWASFSRCVVVCAWLSGRAVGVRLLSGSWLFGWAVVFSSCSLLCFVFLLSVRAVAVRLLSGCCRLFGPFVVSLCFCSPFCVGFFVFVLASGFWGGRGFFLWCASYFPIKQYRAKCRAHWHIATK